MAELSQSVLVKLCRNQSLSNLMLSLRRNVTSQNGDVLSEISQSMHEKLSGDPSLLKTLKKVKGAKSRGVKVSQTLETQFDIDILRNLVEKSVVSRLEEEMKSAVKKASQEVIEEKSAELKQSQSPSEKNTKMDVEISEQKPQEDEHTTTIKEPPNVTDSKTSDDRQPPLVPDNRQSPLVPDDRQPQLVPDDRQPQLVPDDKPPLLPKEVLQTSAPASLPKEAPSTSLTAASSSSTPSPSATSSPRSSKARRTRKRKKTTEIFSQDWYSSHVGRELKVWWPMDKKYYKGTIVSYDESLEKPCKVLYRDGEIEFLDLKDEHFEFLHSSPANDGRRMSDVERVHEKKNEPSDGTKRESHHNDSEDELNNDGQQQEQQQQQKQKQQQKKQKQLPDNEKSFVTVHKSSKRKIHQQQKTKKMKLDKAKVKVVKKISPSKVSKKRVTSLKVSKKRPTSPKVSKKHQTSPKVSKKRPTSPKVSQKRPTSPNVEEKDQKKKVKVDVKRSTAVAHINEQSKKATSPPQPSGPSGPSGPRETMHVLPPLQTKVIGPSGPTPQQPKAAVSPKQQPKEQKNIKPAAVAVPSKLKKMYECRHTGCCKKAFSSEILRKAHMVRNHQKCTQGCPYFKKKTSKSKSPVPSKKRKMKARQKKQTSRGNLLQQRTNIKSHTAGKAFSQQNENFETKKKRTETSETTAAAAATAKGKTKETSKSSQ